jgi:hypothetical protein
LTPVILGFSWMWVFAYSRKKSPISEAPTKYVANKLKFDFYHIAFWAIIT